MVVGRALDPLDGKIDVHRALSDARCGYRKEAAERPGVGQGVALAQQRDPFSPQRLVAVDAGALADLVATERDDDLAVGPIGCQCTEVG